MPKIIVTKNAGESILDMVIEAVHKLDYEPNQKNTTGTGIFIDRPKGWSNESQLSKFVGITNFTSDFQVIQQGQK